MKKKINYIKRIQNTNSLFYWYLFTRRNRFFNHNRFFLRKFKLYLRPIIFFFNMYYCKFNKHISVSHLFFKISNIKARYENYITTQRHVNTIPSYNCDELIVLIVFLNFMKYVYNLYTLFVILFYVKIIVFKKK